MNDLVPKGHAERRNSSYLLRWYGEEFRNKLDNGLWRNLLIWRETWNEIRLDFFEYLYLLNSTKCAWLDNLRIEFYLSSELLFFEIFGQIETVQRTFKFLSLKDVYSFNFFLTDSNNFYRALFIYNRTIVNVAWVVLKEFVSNFRLLYKFNTFARARNR